MKICMPLSWYGGLCYSALSPLLIISLFLKSFLLDYLSIDVGHFWVFNEEHVYSAGMLPPCILDYTTYEWYFILDQDP